VHCPRCGTPNEPGDRFCSSCGATLVAGEPKQQVSFGERLGRIAGTTRKARLVTLATVAALAIALIAFIALKPEEETVIPRDAYTIAADQLCLDAKQKIVGAERQARATRADAAGFAALVPIVASWRSQFEGLEVPADRSEQAQDLEAALLETETKIAGLARVAAKGNKGEIVSSAEEADAASVGVEEAVAALGLSECSRATIGLSGNTR
jgi:zinc ribbon protein